VKQKIYREKKSLYYLIHTLVVDKNNCKYIEGKKRKNYKIYFRDTKKENNYFLVKLKSNYIRGYRINYINKEGKNVNIYMNCFIPNFLGQKSGIITVRKVLISKELFKNWKTFFIKFKENSPSLEWE
jgi:hypothetical protein